MSNIFIMRYERLQQKLCKTVQIFKKMLEMEGRSGFGTVCCLEA